MTTRPLIMVPMIAAGQGHKVAAEALAAHVENEWPGRFDLEVLDFTAAVGDVELDARHKASWDRMLEHPWSAYWGQRMVDRVVPVAASRWVQHRILSAHARHAAAFLAARNPQLIVATHFFIVQALGLVRRRWGLDVPVVGLNPDTLDTHALWTEPVVDEMIVFSEPARRDLLMRGLRPDQVSTFPYLLRPEFPVTGDQHRVRAEFGLEPHQFTVLHTAGGQGIGAHVEHVVDRLLELDPDIQYLVVCGRNEDLRQRLSLQASRHEGRLRLRVAGFVTDMPRWICAADIVVGKAGPASTFEALISGRPILHTSFAAANEKAVLDWCLHQGVSIHVPTTSDVVDAVEALATHPERLERMRTRVAELGLENGGPKLARYLVTRYLGDVDTRPNAASR